MRITPCLFVSSLCRHNLLLISFFLFPPPFLGDAFDDDAGSSYLYDAFFKGPGLATFKAEEVSEMMLPAPKAFTRAITGSLVVSEGVADGTEAEGGPSVVSRRARRSEVEADDTDIEDGLDLESSRNVGDGFASILPGAGTFVNMKMNMHRHPPAGMRSRESLLKHVWSLATGGPFCNLSSLMFSRLRFISPE